MDVEKSSDEEQISVEPNQITKEECIMKVNKLVEEEAATETKATFEEEEDSICWEKLEFSTLEEAREFYNIHARRRGFCTRIDYEKKSDSKKCKTDKVHYMKYVCNKEGFRKNSKLAPNEISDFSRATRRTRCEERTGCKAHVKMKFNECRGVYVISSWLDEHNHKMIPQKFVHMFRSNRRLNDLQAVGTEHNDVAGIRLPSSHDMMVVSDGNDECFDSRRTDSRNHLAKQRQRAMMFGEGTTLLEYFRNKAYRSPGFFYDVQVDIDERVANIFWADATMKMDYDFFGDAIAFDTSYRTKKNCRPLAVFMGFNHHNQVCVFGAALLYDETVASFQWLFSTFLRCMSNKAPQTIFTDQDHAMTFAIKSIFPDTFHAHCTWYMLQDAQKNLGKLYSTKFANDFTSLMYNIDDEVQFNHAWEKLIADYFPYGPHNWMLSIYGFRTQWSSCWVNQHFTAEMRSTQSTESIKAVVRGYLQSGDNLLELFTHFDTMVANRRNAEMEQDFLAINKLPNNHFPYSPIMQSAATEYTPSMFARFQNEYHLMFQYCVQRCPAKDDGDIQAFRVHKQHSESQTELDERVVLVRTGKIHLACTCRLFESLGIFCSHILKVMDFLGTVGFNEMRGLPSDYVLKRWTRRAKTGYGFSSDEQSSTPTDHAMRYQLLCEKMVKLASIACMNDRLYSMVDNAIEQLWTKAQELLPIPQHDREANIDCCINVSLPPVQPVGMTVKSKISPDISKKRLKTAVDCTPKEKGI